MDTIKTNIKVEDEGNCNIPIVRNIIKISGTPVTFWLQNNPINQARLPEQQHDPPAKIPRPPNAFMLYANENRKLLAKSHPHESNKEISCRLGKQWKSLSFEEKSVYYKMSKKVGADHKVKYPGMRLVRTAPTNY